MSARKPSSSKTSHEPKPPYFNREISWLSFNNRVLDLAFSEQRPLLERLKFLSIVSSNLDEFFEIRVAGLLQQVDSRLQEIGPDGLSPREQLRRVHQISRDLVRRQYTCWHQHLVPALRKEGILFKNSNELTPDERTWLERYFEEQVYPVLTPMAIGPAHPFPQLANKSLNLIVSLVDPSVPKAESRMAIIPVPRILPRVIPVEPISGKPGTHVHLFLSDLIRLFVGRLFPGYNVTGAWAFRITRNSDLYIDEEEVENLLKTIEEELYRMRRGEPVRLEIEGDVSSDILTRLLRSIGLNRDNVIRIDGPLNLLRLMSVYNLIERPDLKDKPYQPRTPTALANKNNIFLSILREDHLLHHPYDSFSPVVDFLNAAADDPHVFAIKQTLYRTSGDSPIIEALKRASLNGKQVTALVELKARFDELNNIQWARELEETGVHVVYGLVGLKTHCKCCLVVRREDNNQLRRYCHLGTGNYNPKTARIYTDLSYFTARPEITDEVADLFNTLTGFSRNPDFQHLIVAPFNLHTGLISLIKRETANARAGKRARIILKTNSLIEKNTIDALYEASQAGVSIDCIVRGICGIVPGQKGLSENIRVRSILGRYLEHSRIYYFENADAQPIIYLGSADIMPRNYYRRIECLFPIQTPSIRAEIIDIILPAYLNDTTATLLQPDGNYIPAAPAQSEALFSSQDYFMARAEELRRQEAILHAESPSA